MNNNKWKIMKGGNCSSKISYNEINNQYQNHNKEFVRNYDKK